MSANELILEETCQKCSGKKGAYIGGEVGWEECDKCKGSGLTPTEVGVRILSLIRNNTRLTVSADLEISSH